MTHEDVDHISEKWLSSEDIVLMTSKEDDSGSSCSLNSQETISDDNIEPFKIEPVCVQGKSSKPPLRKEDTVDKEHWKSKKDIKLCPGCGKTISVLQSKHHCRSCGDVFCYYCTRFCRRLNSKKELDSEGKKYKVCINCDRGFSALSDEGQTRSWTSEFRNLSEEKESRSRCDSNVSVDTLKRLSEDTDSRGILRCTSVRGRLLDVYHDDVKKPTTDKLLEKGMKAARGNIFHLFKTTTKDENASEEPEICFYCKTNLNIDGFRKVCKVCDKTFCIDCCDKDVVLQSGASQRRDEEEPVIIFGYKNSTEYDKSKKKERYRVCRFCKSQYLSESFLRDVSNVTRFLIQLQKEIGSIETDDKELPSLQMDYMQAYGKLQKIIAHTRAQRRLKQNVVNAMKEFYFSRLISDSWRKPKQHEHSSCSSDGSDTPDHSASDAQETESKEERHSASESFFDMRSFFRRRSKPQNNAKDYESESRVKSAEQHPDTVSALEQSNEWLDVTVDKQQEQKTAED